MSVTVDANLLLYASDSGSRWQARAREVLGECAEGTDLLHLFWPVLMAYLRIATHPAVFESPLAPGTAAANVERLLSRPNVRALGEGERFWETYRGIAEGEPIRGNLVPDAHLVALMREHGVESVWTHDRDFRRFEGIRVLDPFESGSR